MSTRRPQAVRITTAPISAEEDRSHRQRRYLVSMAIRTACVIAAVLVPVGWPLALCLIGAVVLPYFAVIDANAAAPRPEADLLPDWRTKELPSPQQ